MGDVGILRFAAAGLMALAVGACSSDGASAPDLPGNGGTVLEDSRLDALDLKVIRYRDPLQLEPGSVIDQVGYRQDMARSGFIPGAHVGDDFVLAWELSGLNPGPHTAAKGSPAIVNTPLGPRIVVGGDSGMVYCLTPDGTLVWSAYTHHSAFGIHGTPSVADGVVYIGAYDGALYAIALDSGAAIFRTQIGGSIGSSPVVYDGKVYVSVETPVPSGILAILDAKSGETLWRDDGLRDHPHSSVALDPKLDVMVVGDNSGDLTAWDLASPRRRWVFKTGGAIKGPILVHDGAAYFGSWDRHLYAVELASGQLRWKVAVNGKAMSGAALSPELGLVYMGSHDSYLYALDATTGSIAWKFETDGKVISSPVVAGNRVMFGSNDGRLYIVTADTGDLVYRFRARGAVSSSPALLGDRIVFTERSRKHLPGSMYVLAPRTDG